METIWKCAVACLGLLFLELCNGLPVNLENSASGESPAYCHFHGRFNTFPGLVSNADCAFFSESHMSYSHTVSHISAGPLHRVIRFPSTDDKSQIYSRIRRESCLSERTSRQEKRAVPSTKSAPLAKTVYWFCSCRYCATCTCIINQNFKIAVYIYSSKMSFTKSQKEKLQLEK